ncbi:hypothetical protein [Melittangium boletus]|uniref:hypothetical protein n=1 Tax=Melittangium boletus TaxID=83453 RepID=UPI000BB3055A|nr:hypothetical protein [Melittangium boletus]
MIPWMSRAVSTARTTTAVMRLLETAEVARIEQLLMECAGEANFAVNQADPELSGASPSEAQCKKVLRRENGKDVTRALEFGNKKHSMALDCVRSALGELYPQNISVEPRYQVDPSSGRWRWIDPKQVMDWLKQGLAHRLKGSLVPDVVLHVTGNPNEVQLVYDLKFPCPAGRAPRWTEYPEGHPHHPRNQGEMYQRALGGQQQPALVSPAYGVSR